MGDDIDICILILFVVIFLDDGWTDVVSKCVQIVMRFGWTLRDQAHAHTSGLIALINCCFKV